jgi:hypothetical protein
MTLVDYARYKLKIASIGGAIAVVLYIVGALLI